MQQASGIDTFIKRIMGTCSGVENIDREISKSRYFAEKSIDIDRLIILQNRPALITYRIFMNESSEKLHTMYWYLLIVKV